MQNIKSQFDIGEIIKDHQPENIAESINLILNKGRKNYQSELEKAANILCWENEEVNLLQVFEKASNSQ
jgi:hypothetical protein